MKLIVWCVILSTILEYTLAVYSAISCPIGEEFKACERRCTESCDKDLCRRITQPCEEGCFCRYPEMARANGECVDRATMCDKPKFCGPNETWRLGSNCFEKCKSYDNPVCRIDEYYDCFCDAGYKRNEGGKCVPANECSSCRADMIHVTCGSPCDDLCPNPHRLCAKICMKGCVCPKGFVDRQDKCIPLSSICKTLPPHNKFGFA